MKDLFKKKKGEQQSHEAPAKKPLFAKSNKATTPKAQSPKKPAFSLGKKKAVTETTQAPSKKTAKPKAGGKQSNLDLKKIIIGLIVLLMVVLGALAVKIFFFSDEETYVPPTETATQPETTPSADEPTPINTTEEQTQPEPLADTDMPVPTQDTVSEPAVSEPVATEVVPTDMPTEQAKPEPTSSATKPTESAPVGNITYEEFLKESSQKIHRERSTSPSQ